MSEPLSPELIASMQLAARRTVSRLEASEQALRRHTVLSNGGQLGAGMSVPPIDKRFREKPRVAAVPLEEAGPGAIWDGLDKTAVRSQALARQATPLAGKPPETVARANAPTPERIAHIETALESYATTVQAGRSVASEAWRVVPVVEHMRHRGQLGEAEERAAERFYRDFVLGHRVTGLVSSYGDRIGGSRNDDGNAEEFTRTAFHQKFVAACRAIDHWPTIEWMVRIVCEQLVAAEKKPPTLADAGRAYLHYKDAKQAQAVGATLIKTGLERLVKHYGLDLEGPRR